MLVFLLLPLYTRVLTTEDYGIADLAISTANFITPFALLAINEAVIRFGMDKNVSKRQVLSIGLSTFIAGFSVFLLISPLLIWLEFMSETLWLVYLYVFLAGLRQILSQFVRAIGKIRLFVIDGIFTTIMTILFNLLYLLVFKWGYVGYLLAIISANLCSALFLTAMANLHKYISFRDISPKIRKNMLMYSIPLIPSTIFWWATSVSDRFLVTHFLGSEVNGIYSIAYKIPTLMTLASGIFYQAWQISAIDEYKSPKAALKFYSSVLDSYSALLCCVASGLIMLSFPLTPIIVGPEFVTSWQFVPFLVVAEVFSTLLTFMGTFYMVVKKNKTVIVAIGIGAFVNIALNIVLIPDLGAMGAAFSTLVCYLVAFFIRYVDVRRFVEIEMKLIPLTLSFVILIVQCTTLLSYKGEVSLEAYFNELFLMQLLFVFLIAAINIKAVLRLLFAVLSKKR